MNVAQTSFFTKQSQGHKKHMCSELQSGKKQECITTCPKRANQGGCLPNIFDSFCLAAPCRGASSDALELARLMLGDSRPFPSDHMDNAKG